MADVAAKLAEALELIAATDPIEAALDPQRAIRLAREALRLYDAANHIADASKLVPPIPGAHEVWATVPKEFSDWWDADELPHGNPFREDSPAYWAFAGWQARAALAATAAPVDPHVWLYDFMDGTTTVRNWSTTNKAEAFAPGNFNQRGYVPVEN